MRKLVVLLTGFLFFPALAHAQLSYTTAGGTYSQNFDTLITSGTAQAWANDSTLAGWSLFRQPAPGTALTTYNAGAGASNAGAFYSFGTGTSTERALGGVGSSGAYYGTPSPANGAPAGWITVGFTNNTGLTLDSLTLAYRGEQWRDGGAATPAAQTMIVEYGFGGTFLTVPTWTAAGSGFNFTSPVFVNTGGGAAVDGNAAGLVTGLGGTISSTWNNGDTLWIRFVETNDPGNDHGLAIDDFSFSASVAAVPEPTTYALLALSGFGAVGTWYYRKQQKIKQLNAKQTRV